MSYTTTIPNPSDFLAISQKQLLANYQAIYNGFGQNHVVLDSVINTIGNHTSFTMPKQTIDPTTGATEIAFYNKADSSGTPQLFYRPNSNQTPIQMTNSNSSLTSNATDRRQSTFLPGPFTLYMGYIGNLTQVGQVVTLSPNTTLVYVGVSTILTSVNKGIDPNATATNITGNQFKIQFPNDFTATAIVYYMAIGST